MLRALLALLVRLRRPGAGLLETLLVLLLRLFARSRWRIARRNLQACFADESPAAIEQRLRAHRLALARALLDLAWTFHAPAPLAGSARVEIEGLELLREAAERGQGVLLLSGHFLDTELSARLLAEALGEPVGGVVRRYQRLPCLERLIDEGRRRIGPAVDKFDPRAMLRHLRAGGRLVYLGDQDFRVAPVFAPFFGLPAATFAGIPQLLRGGRARLLGLSMRTDGAGAYRVRVEELDLDSRLDDPQAFAAGYLAWLEARIREQPARYLWGHRRFKTRPPGEPPFYR